MLAALAGICLVSKLLELLITQHPIPSPVSLNADMCELVCLNLVLTASYKIFTEVYAYLSSSKAIHLLPRETFCFDKQSVLARVNSVPGFEQVFCVL